MGEHLNGRQPRWIVGMDIDSGSGMVIDFTINCVKDQVFDGTCGHFDVPDTTVYNYWQSAMIYGDRIPDHLPDNYFSTITGTIDPLTWEGEPIRIPTIYSQDFICPEGASLCYFPDA